MKNFSHKIRNYLKTGAQHLNLIKTDSKIIALFAAIALILILSIGAVSKNSFVPVLSEDQVLGFQPIAVLYQKVIWHPVAPADMKIDSVSGLGKVAGQEFISDSGYPAAMQQETFNYYSQTFKKPVWQQKKIGLGQVEFVRAENSRKYFVEIAAYRQKDGTIQFRAFFSDPIRDGVAAK